MISVNGLTFDNGVWDREKVDPVPKLFRIQSEIVVAVTKNPSSPYRQPIDGEVAPYGEVLVKMVDLTKATLAEELKGKGWILENEAGTGPIHVTGLGSGGSKNAQ
jgi:hypothetical protein